MNMKKKQCKCGYSMPVQKTNCPACGKLQAKPTTLEIRTLVNNLFQDVDTQGLIDTDTANAICSLHTQKFKALFAVVGEEIRKETIKEVEALVSTRSDVRAADPAGTYEEGFDHGYDFKKSEILGLLAVKSGAEEKSTKARATSEVKEGLPKK